MQRKQKKATPGDSQTVAAQVFLRSKSGKSFRDLATATHANIADYRPVEKNLAAARAALEAKGFRVFEDSTGISLSIEGTAELFSKVFGASAKKLHGALPESRPLAPPKELKDLVEEIHVLPRPEFHV